MLSRHIPRAWPAYRQAVMAVRHSSKKADTKHPDTPEPNALARQQACTLTHTPAVNKLAPGRPKYLSFEELPKPPKELQDMTTAQFNARLHMTEPVEPSTTGYSSQSTLGFKYDFLLSPNTISKTLLAKTTHSAFEPNLKLLGIMVDPDVAASGMQEHPLRESITGMCLMNPLLHDIKNKTLWELIPGKPAADQPFEDGVYFNAFKDWESQKNSEFEKSRAAKSAEEKKFNDFCDSLHQARSFVRKSKVKADRALAAPGETSGRRKFDRTLLKQYRKYRKEHGVKKFTKNGKEDE